MEFEDAFAIKKLKIHSDNRGFLVELLRCDEEIFKKFGQIYVTCCEPGFVKAWHFHKIKTDYFTCISGKARVVVFDYRENSPTFGELQENVISVDNPVLVKIPPGCYHGFEAVGSKDAHIISITTEPYHHNEPDEYRLPFNDPLIKFDWDGKTGY